MASYRPIPTIADLLERYRTVSEALTRTQEQELRSELRGFLCEPELSDVAKAMGSRSALAFTAVANECHTCARVTIQCGDYGVSDLQYLLCEANVQLSEVSGERLWNWIRKSLVVDVFSEKGVQVKRCACRGFLYRAFREPAVDNSERSLRERSAFQDARRSWRRLKKKCEKQWRRSHGVKCFLK